MTPVGVVDLHNHIVTEDVVAFLVKDGARLDTRILQRPEGRFARPGKEEGHASHEAQELPG